MTEAQLQHVMWHAPIARIETFFAPLSDAMTSVGIDTPLREAHFLAQIAHESGEMRYTEELASGSAYEGRADLGNVQAGDGIRFKGRGLIQVTGRANYTTFGLFVHRDLVNNNAWTDVAQLPLSCFSATWFWAKHGLNAYADIDDITTITRRINGGVNGLADRNAYLVRAKAAYQL